MIDYCEKKFSDEFSPGLKEMQGLLKKLLSRTVLDLPYISPHLP